MAKNARPLRVIELITILVIAGILVVVILPRVKTPAPHNQPPPVAQP